MNILITAATGTVGRSLAAALSDAGADVRAFVRDAAKARAILPAGIDLAVGDFADPSSLDAALAGVDRVFLAAPNHPDQVDWERNVIDGARRAGVSSLVKLSAHGAERGSPVAFWDAHARIEQHLFASGVPAVVLRPTTYATNLLGTLAGVVKDGVLVAPAAGARVAFIDPADVAAVAAALLTRGGRTGRTLTLTGPSALTFEQVAELFARELNRDVAFLAVTDEQAVAAMTSGGMPAWMAGNIVGVFRALRGGMADLTTATVATVTGREPRPLAPQLRAWLSMPAQASAVGR